MTEIRSDGPWRLAAGVHAASVGDDVVFLSVPRDRYECLPGASVLLDLEPGEAAIGLRRPELVASLFAAGLISPGPSSPRRAPPPLPVSSLEAGLAGLPRWRDLPALTRSTFDIALAYRGRSLADLLAAAACGRRTPGPPQAELSDVVEAFHRWLPWAPLPGKCLLRSFMLLRLLHRCGLDASWVFGVRTWPFVAHCWLQADGVALDEHPDRLAAFTPILVA